MARVSAELNADPRLPVSHPGALRFGFYIICVILLLCSYVAKLDLELSLLPLLQAVLGSPVGTTIA